jgi:hypothetical protein
MCAYLIMYVLAMVGIRRKAVGNTSFAVSIERVQCFNKPYYKHDYRRLLLQASCIIKAQSYYCWQRSVLCYYSTLTQICSIIYI